MTPFDLAPLKIAVLASGNGSNLQALLEHIRDDRLNAEIGCVISDNPSATALQRAQRAGIAAHAVDYQAYPHKRAFEQAMLRHLQRMAVELLVLAGYMRILSAEVLAPYKNKIINVHPSLLPKYPGLNTHQRVLDAGDAKHGASVHFVTAELDRGAVIQQRTIDVLPEDDAESLRQRVLAEEHILLPQVVQGFAARRGN